MELIVSRLICCTNAYIQSYSRRVIHRLYTRSIFKQDTRLIPGVLKPLITKE